MLMLDPSFGKSICFAGPSSATTSCPALEAQTMARPHVSTVQDRERLQQVLARRASTIQPMAGRILLNTFLVLCLLLCTGGECMPAWHVSCL